MSDRELPDYITEGDGFVTVTLAAPTLVSGSRVAILRMREPEVRDLEVHQDSREKDATREVLLFANLCEIAPEEIRALKLRNYVRLQTAFSLFTT